MGNHLDRAIVTHRQDRSAFRHERGSPPRHRDQRVSAHVVGDPKRLAGRVGEGAFQGLAGRECDRMQQDVQRPEIPGHLFEHPSDVFVPGYIARVDWGFRAERGHQFLEPFPLVGECQSRAGGVPRLGDCPGDGPFVRDPENDPVFTRQ